MRDLVSEVTILQIVSIIEGSGIDPRRIIIEVTETALMQDYEQVQASLRILRTMGLKVALDDFGSGQSSLSYVHQLSLDKIKIDRGFIRNIAEQENSRNIVKTVIDLCRNLKYDCVVEGVETAEQVEIICRLGCKMSQASLRLSTSRIANKPRSLDRGSRSILRTHGARRLQAVGPHPTLHIVAGFGVHVHHRGPAVVGGDVGDQLVLGDHEHALHRASRIRRRIELQPACSRHHVGERRRDDRRAFRTVYRLLAIGRMRRGFKGTQQGHGTGEAGEKRSG
jgi:hypothetical protein